MTFPKSSKQVTSYGTLTWDAVEGLYKYDETISHYCTEEAVTAYKVTQQNIKDAEAVRDSKIVTDSAQEEIDWVAAGEATKA